MYMLSVLSSTIKLNFMLLVMKTILLIKMHISSKMKLSELEAVNLIMNGGK